MLCRSCESINSPERVRCVTCGAVLRPVKSIDTAMAEPAPSIEPAGRGLRESAGLSYSGTPQSLEYTDVRPKAILGNRYEIIRPLGKGGMGAVYEAMDRELNRIVALKVIHPNLVDKPEMLQRLRQEVVLARQVTHTNVIRIFDLGIVDGLRFISMEYIEGRQLSSVLEEQRKLPPREAAGIILQICRGLAVTHEKNVVHRDLKPQNIMVEKGGRVVVMDFGIAHSGTPSLEPDREPATNLATNTQVTLVGTILGTPVYMSPEQAKGQPVDARSDLFTLGVIFYELLTGSIPFLGKSIAETLRKRCEESAVPPVALNPQIPESAQ